jgi:hypothetical protein
LDWENTLERLLVVEKWLVSLPLRACALFLSVRGSWC